MSVRPQPEPWWRRPFHHDIAPLWAVAGITAYAGFYLMPREREHVRNMWRTRLEPRCEQMVFDLERSNRQGLHEVAMVAVLAAMGEGLDPASAGSVVALLNRTAEAHGWTSAFLFDQAGKVLLAGGPEADEVEACGTVARRVLISGAPAIDLFPARSGGTRIIHALPLANGAFANLPSHAAVAATATPAGADLYSLLDQQARGEFEAYLVRNEAGRWVRLSPLRARAETPATYNPQDWPGDARVGPGPFVALADDRGTAVRASVLPVPGTPWLAVVQTPQALVDAEVRGHLAMIAGECALLAAAFAIGAFGLWHRRRARMETSLLRFRLRYESLFEQANDAILVLAADGRILEANRRAEELYGRSREHMLRLSLADLADPAGGNPEPPSGAVANGGVRCETTHRCVAGSPIAVEVSSRRLRVDREEITVAIVRDIRRQKEQQEQLLASERQYRMLFDDHPDPMWVADTETLRVLAVNQAAVRHYGYSREEWLGFTLEDIRPPEDVPILHRIFAEGKDQPQRLVRSRHRTKDGRLIMVDVQSMATRFRDRPARLVLSHDVTERLRTEERLHLLERTVEQSPVSIMITDSQGRIEYVNPMFCQVTGYAVEEALGQTPALLESGRHPPEFHREVWETVRAGKEWRGVFHSRKKNGDLFWESVVIAPVTDAAGKNVHFVAVKEDITDRKRLEEQYRQAQKMEAVGRLAGGVAHDFNNLLTVISGFSELSLVGLAEGDRRAEHLREVVRAAERAASLTRQLLAFSRKQILQPQVLNLNDAVAGMEKMLRRLLGEDVEVTTRRAPDLDLVLADPGQVEQVLLNLAVNARDAMPKGGRLSVETVNIELDETFVRDHAGARPGPHVMLAVTDNGCGMTEEVKAHLFEPFFTTKGLGKGTGLGLATIYGIVKQSGGSIYVHSELGKGTTFKVFLPRVEGREPGGARTAADAAPAGGSETILLAEDEAGVARIAGSVLTGAGYRVLHAPNGEAALTLAEEHPGDVHLLLTDLVMPKLGGLDLADRLRARRPAIRVVYMSGYASRAAGESGALPPGAAFLQKPFVPRSLLAKVRRVLDGKDTGGE